MKTFEGGIWGAYPGDKNKIFPQKYDDKKALLSTLKNLVVRDLIKDKEGDHYSEVLEVISRAERN